MEKIIFMDIDGTLTGQDGKVPESAQKAIRKTREKGNLVFLATGRSLPEITDDILSIGFDGIIGAGGAYIEIDGEVILHETMPIDKVHHALDYFHEHDIAYYLESNQGLFASENCASMIQKTARKLFALKPDLFVNQEDPEPRWFYDILNESVGKAIPYDDINKISFIAYDHPFEKAYDYFKDDYEVHHATVFEFGPNSGELGIKDRTKYTAIQKVKEIIGSNYQSYAYGDGLNDVDMFKAVEYAVAMENAKEGLKRHADEICDIAEKDGIYQSFLKNALI